MNKDQVYHKMVVEAMNKDQVYRKMAAEVEKHLKMPEGASIVYLDEPNNANNEIEYTDHLGQKRFVATGRYGLAVEFPESEIDLEKAKELADSFSREVEWIMNRVKEDTETESFMNIIYRCQPGFKLEIIQVPYPLMQVFTNHPRPVAIRPAKWRFSMHLDFAVI